MNKIYITGLGLVSENIADISQLQEKNIDQHKEMASAENIENYLDRNYIFKSKQLVSREDKSLLNKNAQLAIDCGIQAFNTAEAKTKFLKHEKCDFPIFIANETVEYNLASLDHLLAGHESDIDACLANLGEVKKHLNPLDMLRMLSTNALYHVSKLFELQGGGYPIRRMSLSGLCALQEAYHHLLLAGKRAFTIGVGDLTNPGTLCAFYKMGLIKTQKNTNGILPSYGAASIILEKEEAICANKKIYAEVINIKSIYKNDTAITKEDWQSLFNQLKAESDISDPYVISYNNGVTELSLQESTAIRHFFPEATCFSYKKYFGYTGKANNLIDLITALADKRIPCDRDVLINGIGTSSGYGSILIKKINHV